MRQQVMPSEILIADDGSTDETKQVIKEMAAVSPVPLIHVWQPDEGFRLAGIRNKAIAKASGHYMINVDGDVLLHPYFIHDHLRFARPGTFIAGSRVLLTQKSTEKYKHDTQNLPSFYTPSIKKRTYAIRCFLLAKLNYLLRRTASSYLYVVGCNMTFWKNDILNINGYNEAFRGWGKEDNDIALRLMNNGVKPRFLQYYAIVFHLYHPENDRSQFATNDALFRESIQHKTTYITQGLNQYLNH
jgi:glycosyltransferase involved in cell wall biosynthesis